MSSAPSPLDIRNQCADLLTAIETDGRLAAEMSRARRDFFGGDQPRGIDASALEASATRFAEWFVCERPSDTLGAVPVAVAEDRFGPQLNCDLLCESIVGVFLVHRVGEGGPSLRDVIDNSSFDLCNSPESVEVGDVLVGRIYGVPSESDLYVPSAAMAIFSTSPQVAIAYQRDVKALQLARRLTQAEIERLVIEPSIVRVAAAPPLEHLEARLDELIQQAGKQGSYSATAISEALRDAANPSAVIGPLLDEMAFDTDADLDGLRQVLLAIVASVRPELPAVDRSGAESEASAVESTEDLDEDLDDDLVKILPPRGPGRRFEPRTGEKLGEQLARRIEEGLADHEQVEALFADVEKLLGEDIDSAGEEDEGDVAAEVDDGDLAPLVREFVWEMETAPEDAAWLERFVTTQNKAPVPRTTLESIESDDVLRFCLEVWLDSPPQRRTADLHAAFVILDRFYRWAESVQLIDCRDALVPSRRLLIDQADRIDRASAALSADDTARGPAELYAVDAIEADGLRLRVLRSDRELRVVAQRAAVEQLCADDVIVGHLDDSGTSFDGMAIVVPAALQYLLG